MRASNRIPYRSGIAFRRKALHKVGSLVGVLLHVRAVYIDTECMLAQRGRTRNNYCERGEALSLVYAAGNTQSTACALRNLSPYSGDAGGCLDNSLRKLGTTH